MFVKTETILDKILARKIEEIAQAKHQQSATEMAQAAAAAPPARDFRAALHRQQVALIAEIKKASPSKGILIENFDPVAMAVAYAQNGAAALSVLTDRDFFHGSLDILRSVRETVGLPLLRKDFILDDYQIYEARSAGADAVLLIAMALSDAQLRAFGALAQHLGMAALVEVHHEQELERALAAGSTLIGINNRDLRTFHEGLDVTERLAPLVPPDVTLVSESAIRTVEDVRRMGALGVHAILVGEGLVRAEDLGAQVRAFASQPREVRA